MKRRHSVKRNRRVKMTYNYECSLTAEEFTMTAKAANPKDLISVKGYYEMHPEMDDRPEIVKKKLGLQAAADAASSEEKQ